MQITVLLNDEERFQEIPAFLLDELIATGKVRAFLRSNGWAIIGQHPVRGCGVGGYIGPERRKQRKKFCIVCPNLLKGQCISTVRCADGP